MNKKTRHVSDREVFKFTVARITQIHEWIAPLNEMSIFGRFTNGVRYSGFAIASLTFVVYTIFLLF